MTYKGQVKLIPPLLAPPQVLPPLSQLLLVSPCHSPTSSLQLHAEAQSLGQTKGSRSQQALGPRDPEPEKNTYLPQAALLIHGHSTTNLASGQLEKRGNKIWQLENFLFKWLSLGENSLKKIRPISLYHHPFLSNFFLDYCRRLQRGLPASNCPSPFSTEQKTLEQK